MLRQTFLIVKQRFESVVRFLRIVFGLDHDFLKFLALCNEPAFFTVNSLTLLQGVLIRLLHTSPLLLQRSQLLQLLFKTLLLPHSLQQSIRLIRQLFSQQLLLTRKFAVILSSRLQLGAIILSPPLNFTGLILLRIDDFF